MLGVELGAVLGVGRAARSSPARAARPRRPARSRTRRRCARSRTRKPMVCVAPCAQPARQQVRLVAELAHGLDDARAGLLADVRVPAEGTRGGRDRDARAGRDLAQPGASPSALRVTQVPRRASGRRAAPAGSRSRCRPGRAGSTPSRPAYGPQGICVGLRVAERPRRPAAARSRGGCPSVTRQRWPLPTLNVSMSTRPGPGTTYSRSSSTVPPGSRQKAQSSTTSG